MFPDVLFCCENVGRQLEFANFWHFHQWIESFFNWIEFLGLNKVNWIEKRLNSLRKMSKICKITLLVDVFTMTQNLGRQRDFANFWHFHQWVESFFNPIEFLGLNKVNWVEKRLKSCEKTSKFCKIILLADVFTTKQNLKKHSTVQFWQKNRRIHFQISF